MKIFYLLLTLLVLLCSCSTPEDPTPQDVSSQSGSSLRETLEAPDSYQAHYASASGISVINIDAQVIVPDTSTFDILKAYPRNFTDEEIDAFLERHSTDWVYTDSGDHTGSPYRPPYSNAHQNITDASNYSLYHFWITNESEYSANGDYYSFSVHYGLNSNGQLAVMPELNYLKARENLSVDQCLPLTQGKASGCSISLEEAIQYADEEVHALAPDYEITNYGQLPVWESIENPQYYIFRYTRHIHNIPVNEVVYGESSCDNDYDYTTGLSVITVIVRDDGVCYLNYCNPQDLGETVETNCKLLSFAEIMNIFSDVGLLSIQHLEIYEELSENTRDVYKIELGYMSVRQADGTYQYMPVWDFYARSTLFGTGGYAHGKDSDPVYGESILTINAIDGTIIDRSLGY